MKILDILIDSALLLGLTEEVEMLKTVNSETEVEVLSQNEKIKSLLNLVQYSIRELCTNYKPIVMEKKIQVKNNQYALNNLENYIRIQNIQKDNEMVKFKIINRNIVVDSDGEYLIKYESFPTIETMLDEVDYLQEFSPDAIVLGLCAYYTLSHGMFEDFKEFHEKYVARAESLKSLHNFELPARRWEWNKKNLLS